MKAEFKVGDIVQFHTTSNDMMVANNHQCKIVGISTMPGSDVPVYSVEFTSLIVNAGQDELTPVKDKEMLS